MATSGAIYRLVPIPDVLSDASFPSVGPEAASTADISVVYRQKLSLAHQPRAVKWTYGKAKIGNLDISTGVEKDIAWFQI